MIPVELHESEAFAKLAEYEATAHANDKENITQCINKLKLSLINAIGEINYYEIIQSEEYLKMLGVTKDRISLISDPDWLGVKKFRAKLQKIYNDEYQAKRKFQKRWFGRGAWAIKLA